MKLECDVCQNNCLTFLLSLREQTLFIQLFDVRSLSFWFHWIRHKKLHKKCWLNKFRELTVSQKKLKFRHTLNCICYYVRWGIPPANASMPFGEY